MLTHITFNLANAPIRRETLHGRKFIVAPVAMITAGVHNGSGGPLLYEEADIKRAVPAWNMKPIVVYHPQINSMGISAADPDVLEKQQVGMVLNTTYTNGKLRAEAWIEEARAQAVDPRVLDALENNRMMEVSTGLYTDNEPAVGTWNAGGTTGKEYTAIARNHQPDHLAILPDQIGACSIADGAGLLQLNAAAAGFEGAEVMQVARRIVGNAMSHSNLNQAISMALGKRVPEMRKGLGEDSFKVGPWVVDVYDGFFIYEMDGKLYRLHYTNGKAGVEITGDADEVARVTEYRTADTGKFVGNRNPKTKPTKQRTMKKEEIVNSLISNTATPWVEEDRETLMAMEDAVLDKLVPAPAPVANAEPATAAPVANAEPAPAAATTADYIAAAPPEIRAVLQNGLAAHQAEQAKLIDQITGNAANTFTKEFLATKPLDELRGIATLCAPVANAQPTNNAGGNVVPMFIGQATPTGPTTNNAGTAEQPLDAPTINFAKEA